jgi:general stress protein 26
MPSGYGIPEHARGLMSWRAAAARLARSRNYWVVTASPDARPHAVPVWGVFLDGAVCFGTDRSSRKARNLARNPRLVVHLESGDDALMLEGEARETKDAALLARIDKAYRAKYKMKLTDAPGDLVVYTLRPQTAFAWRERDFNRSATRFAFR